MNNVCDLFSLKKQTDPWIIETPPDSTEKRVIKRPYRARTPMVSRLRSKEKYKVGTLLNAAGEREDLWHPG